MANAFPLSLGIGGGLAAWYLMRDTRAHDATPRDVATTAPTARVCKLRLDLMGLTADGAAVSVAQAVELARAAGRANVTVVAGAPAATYGELMIALGRAGVPASTTREPRNARNARTPRESRTPRTPRTPRKVRNDREPRYVYIEGQVWRLNDTKYREYIADNVGHFVSIADYGTFVGNAINVSSFTARDFEDEHWRLSEEPAPRDARRQASTRNPETSSAFTLITYTQGFKAPPRLRWFRSDVPLTWVQARDRLAAAGLDMSLAGRTREPGGWMLSIDPHHYRGDRAEPLPGGDGG